MDHLVGSQKDSLTNLDEMGALENAEWVRGCTVSSRHQDPVSPQPQGTMAGRQWRVSNIVVTLLLFKLTSVPSCSSVENGQASEDEEDEEEPL